MARRKNGIRSPRIAVEVPVEVQKRSFSLKLPTIEVLARYAQFLSAHHGRQIDEERVLEGLIGQLDRDRAFNAWQRQSGAL